MSLSTTLSFTIAATGDPAWYTAQTASVWGTPGSTGPAPTLLGLGAGHGIVDGYSGGFVTQSSQYLVLNGGHSDGVPNQVWRFDFNVAAPLFVKEFNGSSSLPNVSGTQGNPYYPDGLPAARHTYSNVCYIPTLSGSTNGNRAFLPWMFAVAGDGTGDYKDASSYPLNSQQYDPRDFFPDLPTTQDIRFTYTGWCVWDPVGELVWVSLDGGGFYELWSFNPRTKVYTNFGTSSSNGTEGYTTALVDTSRRVIAVAKDSTIYLHDLLNPGARLVYNVTGAPGGSGFEYEPTGRKWVKWAGGKTLNVMTPPTNYRTGDGSLSNPLNPSAVYTFGTTITPATGATPTAGGPQGTYKRFAYIAQPKGFCVLNAYDEQMYFFKIPAGGL